MHKLKCFYAIWFVVLCMTLILGFIYRYALVAFGVECVILECCNLLMRKIERCLKGEGAVELRGVYRLLYKLYE